MEEEEEGGGEFLDRFSNRCYTTRLEKDHQYSIKKRERK